MSMPTITLQDVKRVIIEPPTDTSDKVNREVIILMEDGSRLVLDLWTTNQELKVEIS